MASARPAAVAYELLNDGSLIGAIARGDRGALASLYDRHAPCLLALGLNMLGDGASAESVLEEVFLDTWHAAPGIDPGRCSVRAWLLRRMRERVLARRRAKAGLARLETGTARITGLPPDLAAVLELAYFEGMPCEEIATRLGVDLTEVRIRLERALQVLRELRQQGTGET